MNKVIVIREVSGKACEGCIVNGWSDCGKFVEGMVDNGVGDCVSVIDGQFVNYIYTVVKEES